jgi:ketosteroid isomerase-like protein
MSESNQREPARTPEDLTRLFLERANAGDLDGLVALYEPDAVLAIRTGGVAVGAEAIRETYRKILEVRKEFSLPEQETPLVCGDIALTSTRKAPGAPGGATAEVARRQPDGTWLWAIDQPNVMA